MRQQVVKHLQSPLHYLLTWTAQLRAIQNISSEIYLLAKSMAVKVVFTFNAVAMKVATLLSILFPIITMQHEFKVKRMIHSRFKQIQVNVVFTFNASAICAIPPLLSVAILNGKRILYRE